MSLDGEGGRGRREGGEEMEGEREGGREERGGKKGMGGVTVIHTLI